MFALPAPACHGAYMGRKGARSPTIAFCHSTRESASFRFRRLRRLTPLAADNFQFAFSRRGLCCRLSILRNFLRTETLTQCRLYSVPSNMGAPSFLGCREEPMTEA